MNRKLKKCLDDGERLEAKIREMQAQLKAVHAAQELEENREIVKSIRNMKLNGRELFSLLCGLQDGSVTLQRLETLSQEDAEAPERTAQEADAGQMPDASYTQVQENHTEDKEEL